MDGIHIRGLATEMHGHDRARAFCDCRFNFGGIDIVGSLVRFDWNGSSSRIRHRQPGGNVSVPRDDHFIAGTNAGRPQNQVESIQAVTSADAMLRSAVRSELRLELLNLRSEDESARLCHAAVRRIELLLKFAV